MSARYTDMIAPASAFVKPRVFPAAFPSMCSAMNTVSARSFSHSSNMDITSRYRMRGAPDFCPSARERIMTKVGLTTCLPLKGKPLKCASNKNMANKKTPAFNVNTGGFINWFVLIERTVCPPQVSRRGYSSTISHAIP